MRETRIMMGMPVTVTVPDAAAGAAGDGGRTIRAVFDYFAYIDETFSTYKPASEIAAVNRGELPRERWSEDMKTIFALAEETKGRSGGYFDIRRPDGAYDPSGIVKGWAIARAAEIVRKAGVRDFFIDAGGDIQTGGRAAERKKWAVGIRNPWGGGKHVKAVYLSGEGIATSGNYVRGAHIYNPKTGAPADEVASLTVVHADVFEADRFATAAFAMGKDAINFIEQLPGFEGYMIDKKQRATMTSGFARYARE